MATVDLWQTFQFSVALFFSFFTWLLISPVASATVSALQGDVTDRIKEPGSIYVSINNSNINNFLNKLSCQFCFVIIIGKEFGGRGEERGPVVSHSVYVGFFFSLTAGIGSSLLAI